MGLSCVTDLVLLMYLGQFSRVLQEDTFQGAVVLQLQLKVVDYFMRKCVTTVTNLRI